MNNFYNDNANMLARRYLLTSFEEVHVSWLHHLNDLINQQESIFRVLDVGAGNGRDAKYLAEQSTNLQTVEVVAVEPAYKLAEFGARYTSDLNVNWIDDHLPRLNRLTVYRNSFNLILLSAVWMHIPPEERLTALQTLAKLMTPNGRLIISLRFGPNEDTRVLHPVSVEEIETLAKKAHLEVIECSDRDTDKLGRTQVFWQTLVLQRDSGNVN
ncbi:class I SAM-dependent methyltransferase [Shewanella psychrotolerans]|uniref:class I SAM-dependent methyltransferase n=1 Tax=Shewanella psychrotolerans TaxID=2864206 RepID=UPI001C65567C|nr:class I SAM-dependent methyltransferase [Shewanella psychrotolerans]QYJ99770.1 class I SAM-dependent methyltransferase [Shewanella psychrotolerans]